MKASASLAALSLLALAPTALADGRKPGSVLIYPVHRSDFQIEQPCEEEPDGVPCPTASSVPYFTIVSVTNRSVDPVGGFTNVHFEYVNTILDSKDKKKVVDCYITNRVENLTPADTLSVLTSCHNPVSAAGGYLVITAEDPSSFALPWSFNELMGSELVVGGTGVMYALNALPFASPLEAGAPTDLDADGELDFDGVEYEGIADELYIDSYIALADSSLTLVNLTGGSQFNAFVAFDVWNDNEFALSATLSFRCWVEAPLEQISLVFTEEFLANNTPDDLAELDITCDAYGDIETGWARLRGIVANSQNASLVDPALVGAITAGTQAGINGGRLLWESEAKQLNGDFMNFSSLGSDAGNSSGSEG